MRPILPNLFRALKHAWFRSVRRQVMLTFTITFTLLAAGFLGYLSSEQRSFFATRSAEQARQLADTLAANSVSWVLANDLAGLQEIIHSVSDYPDLRYAMVLSPDGEVLAHSDSTLIGRHIADAASRAQLAAKPGKFIVAENDTLVDSASPILVNQRLVGWARVGLSRASYAANLREMRWHGALYLLLSAVLGTLVALLVARRLTGGLYKLIHLTQKVRQGQRDARVHMLYQDEIAALGADFNRMLDALDESEEKFRKIGLYAQDAIIIIDQDGNITDWNRAAETMFGYAQDEALGKNLHQLLTPPQLLDAANNGLAHFRNSGEGSVLGKTLELVARRRSGEEFPVELSVSSVKLKDSWHAIGIMRDISSRKQAEAMRGQLAAIVESSREAIIGKDLNGIITSWNQGAEHIYGYTAQEIIGRPFATLAPDALKEEVGNLIASVIQGQSVENYETIRQRKDGRQIHVAITLSPVRDESGKLVGISSIAHDITERKLAEMALHRLNRALRTISACNEVLVHASDESSLLQRMCDSIVQTGNHQAAWVDFIERDQGGARLRRAALAGAPGTPLDILPCSAVWADAGPECCPTAQAASSGQLQIVQDIAAAPGPEPWRSTALDHGYASTIALPLTAAGETLGVLTIHAAVTSAFNDDEVRLLDELAADLAFGIQSLRTRGERDRAMQEQQRNLDKLRENLEDAVQAIAATVEMRDPYTAGHQRRVADLAAAIAHEMGLPEDEIHGIHLAGIVHDLGKIAVPAEILSKPSTLSKFEFGLIQAHPQVGYDILKNIDFPWPIADMVLQHHERLDGSGYPRGLKGAEIARGACILAVADVIEAMASHRPYRPGKGIDAALAEIEAGSGTRYDPTAAQACLRLFREKRYTLDSPSIQLA